MRYGVSGANATFLQEASAGAQYLLGDAISAGKTFWLRSLWAYNSASEDRLCLMDAALNATYSVTSNKMSILCASGRSVMIDLPAPGLKFSTACVVVHDGTANATTSTIQRGDAGGCGYEE